MEVALDNAIPTYSGGLGVLAGDTLRSGADLQTPMVAISLLYRSGYFRQYLDNSGHQSEGPIEWDPAQFLKPLDTRVTLQLEGRTITIRPWLYTVQGVTGGTIPVYLLDTDLPENDPLDRALTGALYGGDQRYRLMQEALLGLGGIKVLKALGYDQIETHHMNEGHSTLLTLGLLAEISGSPDLSKVTDHHFHSVRRLCILTTHTPVSAGHDRFHLGLVEQVLGAEWAKAIVRMPYFSGERLNMTHLGLFFSRYVNAVARLHRETASAMYPDYTIKSITNGVHPVTWASNAFAELFDSEIPGWRQDSEFLRQATDIPNWKLRDAHAAAKADLIEGVRQRTGVQMDPNVFTIGFARRAATYKRADLVFTDIDQLARIAAEVGPIQFIFAGKAHPADDGAKYLIQNVVRAGEQLSGRVPLVYVADHDMALGKLLCSGVDLWMNNPRKPMEASGTSGMKAALNGVPSLSILDGWWPEGWFEGVTGWSIADGEGGGEETDSRAEAFSIYEKLRNHIVPMFYNEPDKYTAVMRSSIAINGAYFSSQRMLEQYMRNAYRLV
jgi:starch phosphorylase